MEVSSRVRGVVIRLWAVKSRGPLSPNVLTQQSFKCSEISLGIISWSDFGEQMLIIQCRGSGVLWHQPPEAKRVLIGIGSCLNSSSQLQGNRSLLNPTSRSCFRYSSGRGDGWICQCCQCSSTLLASAWGERQCSSSHAGLIYPAPYSGCSTTLVVKWCCPFVRPQSSTSVKRQRSF